MITVARQVVVPRSWDPFRKSDPEGNETDTGPYEDGIEQPFVGSSRIQELKHLPAADRQNGRRGSWRLEKRVAEIV